MCLISFRRRWAGGASAEEGQLQEKWKELLLQKQEYEKMKVDFEETKDELNKFRHNLAQTQEQAEHDALEFEEQIKSLEDELEKERERVRKVQFELAQRLQELHVTKDQVAQTTSTLHEQIKDRDAQIAKLKRQITVKGTTSTPYGCHMFYLLSLIILYSTYVSRAQGSKHSRVRRRSWRAALPR
jgi:DNA repair exonuclease SbcCD ATPase subunit